MPSQVRSQGVSLYANVIREVGDRWRFLYCFETLEAARQHAADIDWATYKIVELNLVQPLPNASVRVVPRDGKPTELEPMELVSDEE